MSRDLTRPLREAWIVEAVRVKRQLPEGQLLVVPQCGHVVEAERPGIFNPAMTQFFRRTRSAAS